MFTLDIKKSIGTYLIVTILLIALNYIYSLFSHNVSSNYMTYMFLYPVIGGIIVNAFELFNSDSRKIKEFYIGKAMFSYGIATIVVKNFIKGVFQIAGTDSEYLVYYNYISIILIIIGVLFLSYSAYLTVNNKSICKR